MFTAWMDDLKDAALRGVIAARIKRLEHGFMGDVQRVGDDVTGLRIHLGPGWRIYFTQRGHNLCAVGWWLEAHTEERHQAS